MELNLFKVGVISPIDVQNALIYQQPVDTLVYQEPAPSLIDTLPVYSSQPTDLVLSAPVQSPADQTLNITQSLSPSTTAADFSASTATDYIDILVHFVEKGTNADLAVNGKLIDKSNGQLISSITDSYEAHIQSNGIPGEQLQVVLSRKGYKTINTTVAALMDLPYPITLQFEKAANFPYLEAAAVVALIAFAKKRKKKVGKVTLEDVYPFLLIGGGILAFDVVKKVLEALGLWKSKETKEIDAASTDPNSPFSPYFYLNLLHEGVQWTGGINTATADQWLADLDNAFSVFGDNETVAKGILKRATTQATLSFLAWEYNHNTGGDFLSYLRGQEKWYPWGGLSDADISEVNHYILQLPKF